MGTRPPHSCFVLYAFARWQDFRVFATGTYKGERDRQGGEVMSEREGLGADRNLVITYLPIHMLTQIYTAYRLRVLLSSLLSV